MMIDKAEFNQSPSTYKLIMADMSQVYCGRSLSPNDHDDGDAEVVDDRRLASLLDIDTSDVVSYRPARKGATKSGRAKANHIEHDERVEAALRRSVTCNYSTEEEEGSSSRRRSSDTTTTTLPSDKSTSVTGNSNGAGGSNNNATLRRKCQPLHKCATVNQSVSSIMRRPSRYSMTSSSSHSFTTGDVVQEVVNDNSIHSTGHIHTAPSSNTSRRRFSRRASGERGLPAQSMHSYFLQRETSLGNSQRSLSSLDDPWVASGVDFSSSVEVYVFRK